MILLRMLDWTQNNITTHFVKKKRKKKSKTKKKQRDQNERAFHLSGGEEITVILEPL